MGGNPPPERRLPLVRWFVVVGAIFTLVLIPVLVVASPPSEKAPIRNFYIPSEAMSPTLNKNDRLLAEMRTPTRLNRGMIVMIDMGSAMRNAIYIERVAALPGDRVEMIEGEFYLNDNVVPRRLVGTDRIESQPNVAHPVMARRYVEQFPGEIGSHEIYDTHYSPGDDYARTTIPAGHVFVLGDNRDNSADSRFSRSQMGVGIIPISDIAGVASFIYWRPGEGFVNIPLNDD